MTPAVEAAKQGGVEFRLHWDTILVTAGPRGLQIELDPTDLVRLTDAIVAPVAA